MKVKIERFKKVDSIPKVKAFLDICFGDMLIVTGCKIMEGDNGDWLALPSQKGRDDKYYPVVKCVSKEIHQGLQAEILRQAEKQM